MSVRSGLLVVLSLGPAYGLQLHAEIESRTARSGRINVGQIYSTLNRLVEAGLVVPLERGESDQLPRYELTGSGRIEVHESISGADLRGSDWGTMVEHVLLVSSLPGVDIAPLVEAYRVHWSALSVGGRPVGGVDAASAGLAEAADRLLASAALQWLQSVSASVRGGELHPRGLSSERPRRGRRPSFVG